MATLIKNTPSRPNKQTMTGPENLFQIPFKHEAPQTSTEEAALIRYLQENKLIPTECEPANSAAQYRQSQQQLRYLCVASLLDRYRSLQLTLELHLERLKQQAADIGVNAFEAKTFEQLSRRLDESGKKVELPLYSIHQIAAEGQIEEVIIALRHGLEDLATESPEDSELLHLIYFTPPPKPTIRDIANELNISSHSVYYAKRDIAIQKLADLTFRHSPCKAQLYSTIIHLRQQVEDVFFPDCY